MSNVRRVARALGGIVVMAAAIVPAQAGPKTAAVIDPQTDLSRAAAPPAQDLESFFRAQVDEFGLAGLSASIVKDGRVAWSGGFGLADIEKKRPVHADSIFNAGSISKVVTLAAFMRLLQDGRCSLDDAVDRYVSFPVRNPRFPDRPITLRHLLSFTAGIFDVDARAGRNLLDVFTEARDPRVPADDALREYLAPAGRFYSDRSFLESAPGERYEYSNGSYALVGRVVERIAGRPFWDYCREVLFVPLRMDDSTWRLADLDRRRCAYDYERTRRGKRKVEPTTWPGYMDGGLRTTAVDIGNFLIMAMDRGRFEGRQVLDPGTVDAMLALRDAPGAPPGRGFPTIGRAFVWVLSRVGDRRIYQMNGFGPAFFAQVFFDPDRKVGGAFFTTGGFESFEALGKAVSTFVARLLEAADRL